MEQKDLYIENEEERTKEVPAGYLARILARFIDLVIVAAMISIIPGIGYFAGLVYILIADGLFEGMSIGKKLMGLRVVVVSEGSQRNCGYRESVFRNLPFAGGYLLMGIFIVIPLIGWLVSFLIWIIIFGFETLVMIGSEDRTRLGDEIAKTRVIESR